MRWINARIRDEDWEDTAAGYRLDLGWGAPGQYLVTVRAEGKRLHASALIEAGRRLTCVLGE